MNIKHTSLLALSMLFSTPSDAMYQDPRERITTRLKKYLAEAVQCKKPALECTLKKHLEFITEPTALWYNDVVKFFGPRSIPDLDRARRREDLREENRILMEIDRAHAEAAKIAKTEQGWDDAYQWEDGMIMQTILMSPNQPGYAQREETAIETLDYIMELMSEEEKA